MKLKIFKTALSTFLAGVLFVNAGLPVLAAQSNPSKLTGNGKDVKNVILLISDGWGPNQILATDYFMDGKSGTQSYEKFPSQVFMSTYSYGNISAEDDMYSVYAPSLWNSFDLFKNNPTDSAAAGTAMSTGFKTYDAAIGVDQELEDLKHIAEDFEELGRSTGVVSSVQLSHAHLQALSITM